MPLPSALSSKGLFILAPHRERFMHRQQKGAMSWVPVNRPLPGATA